ncbi:porin family protein [Vibrio profundum]|uniref:outer membrane beta-barrel protein n=1 Tax=Vibrio profundum TaxID=2910247 RepID=UPI003D111DC5
MNTNRLIKTVTLLALLSSAPSAYANVDLTSDNQNAIGVAAGYGSMTAKTEAQSTEDDDALVSDIYYRRMLSSSFGVELGYKSASEGFTSVFSSISEVRDIEFSGPRMSGYARYPLGGGFEIYGKAGVTYYTTDYTLVENNTSRDISDSSIGGEVAGGLGWRYEHLGLNLEYNYAKDRNIESPVVMLGASILF